MAQPRYIFAERIVQSAFKIAFPSLSRRVDGVVEINDLLQGKFSTTDNREKLLSQTRGVSRKLARYLTVLEDTEYRNLDPGDKDRATAAVEDALAGLELTRADVIRGVLDDDRLAGRLLPVVRQAWKRDLLSQAGCEYGALLLRTSCTYLLGIVHTLEGFDSEVTWQNYLATKQLEEKLTLAIEALNPEVLPSFRKGTGPEIDLAEADYLYDVVDRFKNVEIFGLDLPRELRRQPVDIAYISLTAAPSPDPRTGTAQSVEPMIGQAIRRQTQISTEREAGSRILIVGGAGSGKTTVVQWLTVSTVRRALTGTLEILNECLPFLVQLRYTFKGSARIVLSDNNLAHSSSDAGPLTPGDWVTRRLKVGKSLVIFDGLDELSEVQKTDALLWLNSLIRKYPKNHYVVTSRPDDLDITWFNEHRFQTLYLQPMVPEAITLCVERWFEALLQYSSESDYLIAKRRLLHDLDNRRSVRELVETPLLCAMLCAFYAHNLTEPAPRTRADLYERVLTTLVDARERGRESITLQHAGFTLREKLFILQFIACRMTEFERSSILTRPGPAEGSSANTRGTEARDVDMSALHLIDERLRTIPHTALTASEALRYLLQRSVVFREVAPGLAQFAHKTLQEYLTARELANRRDITTLLQYSQSPQRREVVSLAAGKLTGADASELVSKLLQQTARNKAGRREALLMVAECLGAALGVEYGTILEARSALESILPPRTLDEANRLSSAGEGILIWLSGHAEADPAIAAACVHAACLIGGTTGSPRALEIVEEYARSPAAENLIPVILQGWEYFEPLEFAQRVLRHLDLSGITVRVLSARILDAVKEVENLRDLKLEVRESRPDFGSWSTLRFLNKFDCGEVRGLKTLAGISELRALQQLNLSGNKELEDIGGLSELQSLEELYLSGCRSITGASALRGLNLRTLDLEGCSGLEDFDFLGTLRDLRTLSINGCECRSLNWIKKLDRIRTLKADVAIGVDDSEPLVACPDLRRLDLRLTANQTGLALPSVGSVREMTLRGGIRQQDLEALTTNPLLRRLAVSPDDGSLVHIRPIGGLSELRELRITGCAGLSQVNEIHLLEHLSTLDLSGCGISDLDFLAGLRSLRRVYLDDCRNLANLDALLYLPNLEYVTVRSIGGAYVEGLHRKSVDEGFTVVGVDETFLYVGHDTG